MSLHENMKNSILMEEEMKGQALRFITCGSVDDGKSTLIGRLLHEAKCVFEDQMAALQTDSKKFGAQNGNIDYALLLDGLEAEREQGITIDVAYRFFATPRRKFIVADTPGHEQYTRNMATGASNSDAAVILVDARKGILTQTMRHSRIVSMMGIKNVVLAINKMDLVGYKNEVFEKIVKDYESVEKACGFSEVKKIPLSALMGDNVCVAGDRMEWYRGQSLLSILEGMEPETRNGEGPFLMPVQYVNRPNPDFRGFCGRVAQGEVRPNDEVRILPSGVKARVREVVSYKSSLESASAGDSVTITLEEEVDVSRGDVIASASQPPQAADQFEAQMIWMSDQQLDPGRQYLLKMHCKEVTASVTHIKYKVDMNTGARLAAKSLALNEIAVVNMSFSQPVVFEPYSSNRILGGFILLDKLTYETVGAGMIDFALRRASNIHWQALEINKSARASLKNQKPVCLWFTGLSGAGKSTVANLLEKKLHSKGMHTYILDGDNVRHGLNRDLGFTEEDRVENIRRVAEVAKLMVDAGLIAIVSFISPFRSERRMARELFAEGEFLEVFVDTPLEECEKRDPKGLFAKARRGELKNFTGIDSPYEAPENPELTLFTVSNSLEDCVDMILRRANLEQ